MSIQVKTFQAASLPDALQLVRDEFGPDATVLNTESKSPGLWNRLWRNPSVEVTAMRRPSEATPPPPAPPLPAPPSTELPTAHLAGPLEDDYRERFRKFAAQDQPDSLLEAMIGQQERRLSERLPASLFRLYNELIEADVDDRFARELIEDVQRNSTPAELSHFEQIRHNAAATLVRRIDTVAPINTHLDRRVIALVGPTGVGKTTTVAKLAANLRLRDKRRVGLITVDTYRIAAVEQLRAYAQIIDLPMEVVTTPREIRNAVSKLSDVDIVLIDTAGRSATDEIQIQELKSMLSEAHTDEVQLVLSSVASSRHLTRLVEQFSVTRPTSLLLTKLDEISNYGHLLPLLCGRLPLAYTTHGQSVPDDIQPANPKLLVESILHE